MRIPKMKFISFECFEFVSWNVDARGGQICLFFECKTNIELGLVMEHLLHKHVGLHEDLLKLCFQLTTYSPPFHVKCSNELDVDRVSVFHFGKNCIFMGSVSQIELVFLNTIFRGTSSQSASRFLNIAYVVLCCEAYPNFSLHFC